MSHKQIWMLTQQISLIVQVKIPDPFTVYTLQHSQVLWKKNATVVPVQPHI